MPIVAQTGQGLAAGLDSVFAHFAHGNQRVIAFNSDSPHLPASVLKSAFDSLDECDLVLGPDATEDIFSSATKEHPIQIYSPTTEWELQMHLRRC